MMRNTFCHVPGIGARKERSLWAAGIHSWDICVRAVAAATHSAHVNSTLIAEHLTRSMLEFDRNNPQYFAALLPHEQHWRLFGEFRHSAAFLDIETTGLGTGQEMITTIALYDGQRIRHYVHGQNLDQFIADVQEYTLLVTYNGKCFDIPFIEKYFGTALPQAQIDLRYVLRALGYKGGLKRCEAALGIDRHDLAGVDGYIAVLLWREFAQRGNQRALETLLAYNIADATNLERLMVTAYNLNLAQTPFLAAHKLALPQPPEAPFRADSHTLARIAREHHLVLQYAS